MPHGPLLRPTSSTKQNLKNYLSNSSPIANRSSANCRCITRPWDTFSKRIPTGAQSTSSWISSEAIAGSLATATQDALCAIASPDLNEFLHHSGEYSAECILSCSGQRTSDGFT